MYNKVTFHKINLWISALILPLLSSCSDVHSPDVYSYDGANEVQTAEKGTIIQVRHVKIASANEKKQTAGAVATSLGGAAVGGASGAAIGKVSGKSGKSTAIGASLGAVTGTAIAAGLAAAIMDRPKDALEYTVELDDGSLRVIAQTGKEIMKVGDRCLVITSEKWDERGNVKSRVVPFTEPTKR